jgi:hypothetical protein
VVRVRDGAQGQGLGQEGDVVALDVPDDQDLGLLRVLKIQKKREKEET